jgi:hypothetical protein
MAYGDGTVYQRGDGRWVARYVAKTGAKPKYLYGKTETEVKRKLRAYKQSPEVVIQTAPKTATVDEYLKNWLQVFKRPTVKASTYDRLESVVRGTIRPRIRLYHIHRVPRLHQWLDGRG